MILALDPGATTGWANAFNNGVVIGCGQLDYDAVWPFLNALDPEVDTIVMESFLFRQMAKIDFRPVEIIGVVKLYCHLNDVELFMQTPAAVKHFWTDARLKERKLYRIGNPHANDAMRHLLHFQEFGKGKHV